MFFVCMVVYIGIGALVHSLFWEHAEEKLANAYAGPHQILWTIVYVPLSGVLLLTLLATLALWPITLLLYLAYRMGTTPKVSF